MRCLMQGWMEVRTLDPSEAQATLVRTRLLLEYASGEEDVTSICETARWADGAGAVKDLGNGG